PLKQTLQGAAVVGRRFGISLSSRILEVAPDPVAEHLRELHGLDFVFPSAHEPEPMYSFKHALTQDVVYAGVLERRRRQHHAAAGHGLEELYAGRIDDVVEFLAYHFGRSAEAEKAVDYAILAASKAQRRWANTEALAFFDDALKRLEGMPDTESNRQRRIDAVVKQAEVMFALGRHAEQVKALEAIRALTVDADPPRRAAWLCWTGFLHSLTGARPEVPIAYDAATARALEGFGLAKAGKTEEGIALLEGVAAWLDQQQLPYTRSVVGLDLAESYLRHGARAPARTVAETVRTASRELGYR